MRRRAASGRVNRHFSPRHPALDRCVWSKVESVDQSLSGGSGATLDARVRQATQPELVQRVPVFRLGKERLYPDVLFTDGFLALLGGVGAAHLYEVGLIDVALQLLSLEAGGAARLERAGVAEPRWRWVDAHPSSAEPGRGNIMGRLDDDARRVPDRRDGAHPDPGG